MLRYSFAVILSGLLALHAGFVSKRTLCMGLGLLLLVHAFHAACSTDIAVAVKVPAGWIKTGDAKSSFIFTRPPLCTCENGQGATGAACTADGAKCASCDDGFSLEGTACVAKDCTASQVLNSKDYSADLSITGTTGQTVQVACNDGYGPGGVATCLASGTFSSPVCLEGQCAASSVDFSADYSAANSITGKTGEKVDVSCAEGYSGGGQVECLATGSFTTVQCTANDCTASAVPNSDMSGTGSITGKTLAKVPVVCDAGYSGGGDVTCTTGGTFTTVTCDPVPCTNTEPSAQTGYTFATGAVSTFGASRSASCATGYSGTAQAVSCQSDQTWSISSGCSIQSCPALSQTGYTFAAGTSTYGSTRTATCATGYSGTGASVSCTAASAGQTVAWTASSGCSILSCPTSPTQTNYVIAAGASTYGSTRAVTCGTGYTGSPGTVTCQADQTWTAASGCTQDATWCPAPSASAGFAIASGSSVYNSERTVTCTGFGGQAATPIKCQADKTWTAPRGCFNFISNGNFAGGKDAGTGNTGADNALNEIVPFANPGATAYALRQTAVGGSLYSEYQMDTNQEMKAGELYVMSCWYTKSADWDGTNAVFHARGHSTSGAHTATGADGGTTLSTKVVGGLTWTYAQQVIQMPADFTGHFNWYLGYPSQNTVGYKYFTNVQIEPGTVASPFIAYTPQSCKDIHEKYPTFPSGRYRVIAPSGQSMWVICDMDKNGGGWTRFLQLNSVVKNCAGNYADVPLTEELVGSYCADQEYTFSRSMMIASNKELLFTDTANRMMWYRFTNCNAGQCTCDRVTGDAQGECFFLSVTADYTGGAPLMGGDNYDIFSEAYNWNAKAFQNQGDGQCGGTNANGHSQFNCEPHAEDGMGTCGQRWHYGTRDDASGKGGSACPNPAEGCAWGWYTGLATGWAGWAGGCGAAQSAWMIDGPQADGLKTDAVVYFR